MIRKTCAACGRIVRGAGNRCELHAIPKRSGTYTRNAKRIVENATHCHLCGQGPRPGDPFVADHLIPRAYGGSDDPENLAPAHRSCNGRRGARLQGEGAWSARYRGDGGRS